MANLLEGLAGAGAGFAAGGPIGGLIGGIGSLFSHKPKEDPVAQQQRLFQQNIANRLLQYSQGVPGSDPQELAGLASARGALGAEQRNYQGGIFSNYSPQMRTSMADMASNLASRFSAQQMALQETQLQASLQARRDALLQAAQVAPKAGAQYQPNPLPQVLGSLMQTVAYQQARQKGGAQAQAAGVPPGQGGGPPDMNTGWNPMGGGQVAQYPGNTPPPGGGGPAPAGGPFLPGGPLQAMQDAFGGGGSGAVPQAQTQSAGGPTLADQTLAAQMGALPNPANGPGGINGLNNQIRQASGLSYGTPWWEPIANPYGLKFGT